MRFTCLVELNTVPSMARHRCDVSLKLCCPAGMCIMNKQAGLLVVSSRKTLKDFFQNPSSRQVVCVDVWVVLLCFVQSTREIWCTCILVPMSMLAG